MEDPTLVVVIPTKNRRALLERAIASVYTQKYGAWRMVIVNDGSTDGTRAYLDSLKDSRITVVNHEKNRGVNAARNAAYRKLGPGEWATPLDDDDTLLPGALERIASAIKETGGAIPVLFFNTVIHTPEGKRMGGRDIGDEPWHDLTYREIMTRWSRRGDGHVALKASLFPQYFFSEDVNGFESEIFMRMARDGIRMRYFPTQTLFVDRTHETENLSNAAARRDPKSFARVHRRIFRDHARFFSTHPRLAMERAAHAAKVAVRALDPGSFCYFAYWYARSLFGIPTKGMEREAERKQDADAI